MNESELLANRVRGVLLNGTLIANTNYRKELVSVDFDCVNVRYNDLNSIALLSQHVHYYVQGIIHAFDHGTLEIRDKFSFEFAPITTPQAWDDFVGKFCADSDALIERIEGLSNHQLLADFTDSKYGSFEHNINMLIEHSYYHLGQLVLVKKLTIAEQNK